MSAVVVGETARRLEKNSTKFRVGDWIIIDQHQSYNEAIKELLNDYGFCTFFEVVEVKEPSDGYESGQPQIIVIRPEAEEVTITEEAGNFLLVPD